MSLNIEITEEKKNPLIERTELTFRIENFGVSTPNRLEVKKKIAAMQGSDDRWLADNGIAAAQKCAGPSQRTCCEPQDVVRPQGVRARFHSFEQYLGADSVSPDELFGHLFRQGEHFMAAFC